MTAEEIEVANEVAEIIDRLLDLTDKKCRWMISFGGSKDLERLKALEGFLLLLPDIQWEYPGWIGAKVNRDAAEGFWRSLAPVAAGSKAAP